MAVFMSPLVHPVICLLGKRSLSDIASIDTIASAQPWAEAHFEAEFAARHSTTLGARAHGEIVGFIIYHTVFDEAHILNVVVHPDMQSRGVGRALLAEALERLQENSVRWATLEVRVSNKRAQRLYASFGFEQVGVRSRYYSDNGEDAVLMTRDSLNYTNR
jgi:[ribosomal protein S18]-alanine N-acetyltransferase